MPRLLELFSGTGSVGRVFEQAGWEVVSVDIEAKFNPTICCSILDIPLDKWPPKYFDVIWAAPVCKEYSIAHTSNERNLLDGNRLALYALHLIDALQPRLFWLLENPASGLLKTRPFMEALPYVDTSYCMYGFPYRKRTRIWNNVPGLELLNCDGQCPAMVTHASGKRGHRTSAQKGPSRGNDTDVCYRSEDLYRIPPALVETILHAIDAAM